MRKLARDVGINVVANLIAAAIVAFLALLLVVVTGFAPKGGQLYAGIIIALWAVTLAVGISTVASVVYSYKSRTSSFLKLSRYTAISGPLAFYLLAFALYRSFVDEGLRDTRVFYLSVGLLGVALFFTGFLTFIFYKISRLRRRAELEERLRVTREARLRVMNDLTMRRRKSSQNGSIRRIARPSRPGPGA